MGDQAVFDNEKMLEMYTMVHKLHDTVIGNKNEEGMHTILRKHSDMINVGKGMFIIISCTVGFILQHIM